MNSLFAYHIVEAIRMHGAPLRSYIALMKDFAQNKLNPTYDTPYGLGMRASFEMLERITRKYEKLNFNIHDVTIDGIKFNIFEEVIRQKPFCNLLRFQKANYDVPQKKMLIVAPMAGHHATLLRDTIHALLPYFDVYTTDWLNPAVVDIRHGEFGLDDYIDYLINFFEFLGPNLNVVAVCQPVVPTLAATAILSSDDKSDSIPSTITLMAGPVDARKSPTNVDKFAAERSLKWFEEHVITVVPNNYPGVGRKVYPGFLQLAGFISMNYSQHIKAHLDLFEDIFEGDEEHGVKRKRFYDEYLAVMDIPAAYYLQTIKEVFQDFSLANGTMTFRDRNVDLTAIKETALLCIEGELDDIAGLGQTKAALDLCSNIPDNKKFYYMQKEVGHYGVFNGTKFKNFIVPQILQFIKGV